MSDLLAYIPALILILGPAVILHEFGHFIVAKLLKIRVETFSVGFGPRLFGRRWGTTDYRLSLIPLGGYVKLGGDESNAPIEGDGESDIPVAERFDLRPRWQKFLVMIAGPTMNILTALAIVFAGALKSGVPVSPAPVVDRVAEGGTSERAGLRPGDRIVFFNGVEEPSWQRIKDDATLSPEQPLPAAVERAGQRVDLTITPGRQVEDGESIGTLDFRPDYGALPVMVDGVLPDSPAAKAGLQVGDRILSINGQAVGDEGDVRDVIRRHKTEPLHIQVERGGAQRELVTGTERLAEDKIGVTSAVELPLERVGPVGAARFAVQRNVEVLRMTGAAFGQIFRGQRSARESLAGPIGIARQSSQAISKFGLAGLFTMLGFLSLNLGIVNLLPIPVLDGGAIFLLLVETVLGWVGLRLSLRLRERIQFVGFFVLLLLMGFVITNDILKEVSSRRGGGNNKPAATTPAK
ncbi:MAG TPA: RIP metalloprotease RseP [Pyrinomonadaceae bacterium]|nr:RIP metalloprotease RseP [Pyrinomonadaceae bacterium]